MKPSLAFCLLFFTLNVSAQVSRVEPPFWWVGMNKKSLQLMLYGEDLQGWQVTSQTAGVEVLDVRGSENPNYLFVDLQLGSDLPAGVAEFSLLDRNGQEHKLSYEFKLRRPGSALREGFSAKDVIYLITPDRFANGVPENDSVDTLTEQADRQNPDGRHGGDIQGITANLPYLADLGVTQLWMNPLQENDEPAFSYHGYSISDLYSVDARLGGNQALLELSEQAKRFGIGLIMDTVPNHIGINHWWMQDLPADDWINNDAKFAPTSHRREIIQDPHASKIDKREMNDHWFVPTMPDLNQGNANLATYLIQNNIWWVEYADLAGLRVDTLPYADKEFTAQLNLALLSEYPQLNLVGEEWSTNPAIVSYWQQGKVNQDGFEGHTPSLMDFPLQEALVRAFTEEESWDNGLIKIYQALANDFQYPQANNLVVIADNHDMSRIFTQLNEDFELFKMAMTFLFTTRGIPQLFYGTEILMANPDSDKHGIIRSDFPGGWPGDESNAFTGKGLSGDAVRAQKFLKKLLNWRKQNPVIHNGALTQFAPGNGLYAYIRHSDEKTVAVLFNKNNRATEFDTQRLAELGGDARVATDVLNGRKFAWSGGLNLPAKSALILELE